ncbi:MAG: S8 family serine peptidase [Bacteriovorax sp.]|nr:S8 family serine peptidase [Bacteriovorax sp.]
MKILIPLLALVQLSTANASLVGIMDSGTDITHKDLAPKAWFNRNEKAGSLRDLDNDGLPGDIHGWDFTENSAKVFNDDHNDLITADVKTFYNYYSMYELGKLNQTSAELVWLKSHTQDQELMNKVNFVGGYIHGTHVAGISSLNNAQVKILSLKIIPTVYQELKTANHSTPKTVIKNAVLEVPTKTVDEYTAEILDSATQQVDQMVGFHALINFHKVDVVNQSFGIGYGDACSFIKAGFVEEVKRDPTDAEMAFLVKAYFSQLLKDGRRMFAAAPNTIFTIAAGNDALNNDLFPDYPADVQAENKIVVAATVGYKSIADFSNYGATKVDVAAPGVAITSTAPTNVYIALSGTSQATPYVTNIIAAMKDLNPALSARDLKAIILGTVDVKSWLKGKVKTSGIVNKPRALKAAMLAKSQTVDLAISNARATILDIAVEKSLSVKPTGLTLNFRPLRPSLLIPKI